VTGLTDAEREALGFQTPGSGGLLAERIEAILTDRLAAHEAREAELTAALEAGDACGAVGCRALAERDALLEREERVRALADEWERRYAAGDHMVACPDGAGWYDLLADRLRVTLDGPPA